MSTSSALTAGLMGGVAACYVTGSAVLWRKVRRLLRFCKRGVCAQNFTLVDQNNQTAGTFTSSCSAFAAPCRTVLVLFCTKPEVRLERRRRTAAHHRKVSRNQKHPVLACSTGSR